MPFVIISGCSSGGKSTLLDELARRGHATVPEPGRRVVREEQASGGTALPWADTRAFVDRIVALAKAGYGLFRVLAPSVTGGGSDDVQRQRGISELLSYVFLAGGGALIFFRAWHWLPEHAED